MRGYHEHSTKIFSIKISSMHRRYYRNGYLSGYKLLLIKICQFLFLHFSKASKDLYYKRNFDGNNHLYNISCVHT